MPSGPRIFIAGSVRTPIGKFGGALKSLSAADLGEIVSRETIARVTGITPDAIDQTWFGCARQAGVGPNVARQVAYRAGIGVDRPASTINMACASSLEALITGARSIKAGDTKMALIGGTESMSNVPHMIFDMRWGISLGRSKLVDAMYHDGFHCKLCDMLMGATADKIANEKKISRRAQDEFALLSQQRTEKAQKENLFDTEITPVTIKSRKGEVQVTMDEHPRHGTTIENLEKLKPVFADDGTVTAGNACGITDGASSMVIYSESKFPDVTPEVELIAYAQSGVEPDRMGLGPVPAINALLESQKLKLSDIDLIELNEAFAGQVLACDAELHFDMNKLNVHGGAIALGHPIGATGARILTTLIHAMKRYDKELGMAALCVSGGQGTAVLVKRV